MRVKTSMSKTLIWKIVCSKFFPFRFQTLYILESFKIVFICPVCVFVLCVALQQQKTVLLCISVIKASLAQYNRKHTFRGYVHYPIKLDLIRKRACSASKYFVERWTTPIVFQRFRRSGETLHYYMFLWENQPFLQFSTVSSFEFFQRMSVPL